jgi:hypothetical protein
VSRSLRSQQVIVSGTCAIADSVGIGKSEY